MKIIPVIDLMNGKVVHAKLGFRELYCPIKSVLSETADAIDVINGYLTIAPFETLYIADLDSIRGLGSNFGVLLQIRRFFPKIELWVDCGFRFDLSLAVIQTVGVPVIGSEAQNAMMLISSESTAIISLDFRGNRFDGPLELLVNPIGWSERIIVMALAHVGTSMGPDLNRIKFVRSQSVSRQIYAAGGVRDTDDLRKLKDLGVNGVLVASALHNGRICSHDLLMF